jgi:hypothetical protein
VSRQDMLLQTKYWQYFLRLCVRTGFEISTLQEIISSLRQGRARRAGDYTFVLVSKEEERFGTVYRIEVYEGRELVLKSPVLLHEPLKDRRPGYRMIRRKVGRIDRS